MFSPDRCLFWERSPLPRSMGFGLCPPMSLFTMILEEGVESPAADCGSGAARVAEGRSLGIVRSCCFLHI